MPPNKTRCQCRHFRDELTDPEYSEPEILKLLELDWPDDEKISHFRAKMYELLWNVYQSEADLWKFDNRLNQVELRDGIIRQFRWRNKLPLWLFWPLWFTLLFIFTCSPVWGIGECEYDVDPWTYAAWFVSGTIATTWIIFATILSTVMIYYAGRSTMTTKN